MARVIVDTRQPWDPRVKRALVNYYSKVGIKINTTRVTIQVNAELTSHHYDVSIADMRTLLYTYLPNSSVELSYDKSTHVLNIKKYTHKKRHKTMKIKFKKATKKELDSQFLKVSEEDYALLADQIVHIDRKSYSTIQKNKFLQLGNNKIPIDLIQFFLDGEISDNQEAVQNAVAEKFINSEDVVDVLMAGIENEKNVILFGRGGHGKSDMTTLVMEKLQELGVLKTKPFVQAFGDGMTEDRLFGGMDVKKYKEKGKIEYLLDNSFMEHEVVIFEEIFDAPAQVLLSLKDVLTRKAYANGNQYHPLKTKVIIGLTNKSKEDFAEKDESLKALAERFPLTLKVEWPSYGKNDFVKLIRKVHGEEFYNMHKDKVVDFAEIVAYNNSQSGSFCSPRTAVVAAELFCKGKDLKYISDLDPMSIQEFKKKKRNDEEKGIQEALIQNINNYINTNKLEVVDTHQEFFNMMEESLAELEKEMGEDNSGLMDEFKNIKVDASAIEVKVHKLKYIQDLVNFTTFLPELNDSAKELNKRIKEMHTVALKEYKSKTKTDDGDSTTTDAEVQQDSTVDEQG